MCVIPRSRILRSLLGVLLVGVSLASIACNDSGPTDPDGGPLLPDFDCQEVRRCALTCSDRTTGGQRPYQLFWQADEQAPTSVINPTFTWDFAELELVRVRLSVRDEGGSGDLEGPLEKAFEICADKTAVAGLGADSVAGGATSPPPVQADFGWDRKGFRVDFINTSQGARVYRWDFGDGSPRSSSRDPFHTYARPGLYRVHLLACRSDLEDATDCDTFDDAFEIRR